jgi:chromate transporter
VTLVELLAYVFTYNVVTLSNGPVMVAMLQQTLVHDRRVMTLDQLLFAFTIGRVTPGPASSWLASVGYMKFGWSGAALCIVAITVPGYLMLPLVHGYRRIATMPRVDAFLRGLIAAQVGLIFAASVRLGGETLTGPAAWSAFVATFVMAFVFRAKGAMGLLVGTVIGGIVWALMR